MGSGFTEALMLRDNQRSQAWMLGVEVSSSAGLETGYGMLGWGFQEVGSGVGGMGMGVEVRGST